MFQTIRKIRFLPEGLIGRDFERKLRGALPGFSPQVRRMFFIGPPCRRGEIRL